MNFDWLRRAPKQKPNVVVFHVHAIDATTWLGIAIALAFAATYVGYEGDKLHDERMRSFTMECAAEEGE